MPFDSLTQAKRLERIGHNSFASQKSCDPDSRFVALLLIAFRLSIESPATKFLSSQKFVWAPARSFLKLQKHSSTVRFPHASQTLGLLSHPFKNPACAGFSHGRLERIELSISAPQTEVLPLNYSRHTRAKALCLTFIPENPFFCEFKITLI
ncbi:MAG: hypothetical protein QG585_247 [Patescibacteria group bacterium]|nr:hypothetical protein [Patescibacteria group bacterium]